MGQADLVRRAMSKKKHDVMEQERAHFIDGCTDPGKECPGCVANGIPREICETRSLMRMSSFASYAFNKSHAAAYAVVAYQTAYLKCHYVRQFMAALADQRSGKYRQGDRVFRRVASGSGSVFLPPDINKSGLDSRSTARISGSGCSR